MQDDQHVVRVPAGRADQSKTDQGGAVGIVGSGVRVGVGVVPGGRRFRSAQRPVPIDLPLGLGPARVEAGMQLDDDQRHALRQQGRLVQQEKLASLGQLTAGIAHEIKNPLNFVNNFAELNAELAQSWPVITEMKDPPPDADDWKDKPDKLQYLER